jgi:Lipocalin-like domain
MNANTKALTVASSLVSDAVQKQLIGTWKIMAFEDRADPNSEWTYPYGKNPKGYFVYDNTGHVMIQIMKTPPSLPFASGDDEKPTGEEVKTAFTGYVAYFGTYTVDAAKNIVIHHVEGSLKPSFIGTDQPRPFILAGDRLIIGDNKTWRRVLERVK